MMALDKARRNRKTGKRLRGKIVRQKKLFIAKCLINFNISGSQLFLMSFICFSSDICIEVSPSLVWKISAR